MRKLFIVLATGGSILVIAEITMRMFHSTICSSEGCKLVSESVRYGDITILVLGALMFLLLTLASIREVKRKKPNRFIELLLILSLTSEGFLVGYQIFRVHHICYFCFGIFSILVFLTLLRTMENGPTSAMGFLCFTSIVLLFWMVLPPKPIKPIPAGKKLILIYDTNCPHCENVIRTSKKIGIKMYRLKVANYKYLLKYLNINEVPVLIASVSPDEKKILIGEFKIEEYLNKLSTPNGAQIYNSTGFIPQNGVCTIGGKCR